MPEPLADLAVGEALELAHDEDVVVGLRQPAERAAEVVDRELRVDDARPAPRRGAASRPWSPAPSASSASKETSRALRVRRKASMQAFLAIS